VERIFEWKLGTIDQLPEHIWRPWHRSKFLLFCYVPLCVIGVSSQKH